MLSKKQWQQLYCLMTLLMLHLSCQILINLEMAMQGLILVGIRDLLPSMGVTLEINKLAQKNIEGLARIQVLIALDWVYNVNKGDLLENEKMI